MGKNNIDGKHPAFTKANIRMCTRIRDLRKEQALTQVQFALKLRITESAVKHIEGHRNLPSYTVLRTIAKKFAVTYDYLLDGKID